MTKVVNLFGGPGAGKSTTAAGVFYELKRRNVSCELVREFAKDKVWEGSEHVLSQQIYVFAKQLKRMLDLQGKVDVIITDAPIALSLVYGQHLSDSFKSLVDEEFSAFENENFYIDRAKAYVGAGRLQTEKEARAIDLRVADMLSVRGYSFTAVTGDGLAVETIVKRLDARGVLGWGSTR